MPQVYISYQFIGESQFGIIDAKCYWYFIVHSSTCVQMVNSHILPLAILFWKEYT